jgi:dihydroxyacetone kinase
MQFINKRDTLVSEALDGLLRLQSGGRIGRLQGEAGLNVIVDLAHKGDKHVAVISGGGSGHEPAHAGFVGKGMLAAAVCGDVFASPSVDAVLAGIMAVTGKAGCLLVVKNYTGDRLNFGLAAERARALGKKVEVVIVADDVALPGLAQPRGVAGTLFVHKVAGHMSAAGKSLADIARTARQLAGSIVSLGISLGSCTIPAVGREDRVPAGKAELGLGIHGEPGANLISFAGAHQAATLITEKLAKLAPKAPAYAMLLNNLGGTTGLEMGIIANDVLSGPLGKKIKYSIGPAPLMTALDMHGFSISLLPLTPAIEKALTSAVAPKAWPGASVVGKIAVRKSALPKSRAGGKASRNDLLSKSILAVCDALIAAEKHLNDLDAKVGDGDTGSTVARAARSVKASVKRLPLADHAATLQALSGIFARNMGGSSGVLMAILFSSAGASAKDGAKLPAAFMAGLERLQFYGGAKAGDRTSVDALLPALKSLAGGKPLNAAAQLARKGADATAKMTSARAGRSSYVAARNLKGHKDPGAEAVAIAFESLARSLA